VFLGVRGVLVVKLLKRHHQVSMNLQLTTGNENGNGHITAGGDNE
jgi:hypothetical protein